MKKQDFCFQEIYSSFVLLYISSWKCCHTLILIAFHSKEKCTINTFFLVYNVFVFVFEQIHDVPIDTHRNCNLAMFTMPTSVPLDTFQSKRLHDNDINALSIAFVCSSLMTWTCFMLIKIDLVFFSFRWFFCVCGEPI